MADDMGGLDARFRSLEEASRNLSLDVQGLNETLKIVAHLQQEQSKQRQRQDAADAALVTAKVEADQRERRGKRNLAGLAVAVAIVFPLASILVYWSLLVHVNDLLTKQKAGFYNSCITRNKASTENALREQRLAAAEKSDVIVKIHLESADALSKSIVDCSSYLPRK